MSDLPSSSASGFQCDRCSHCCRSHRVPVTRADVRRLTDQPLKISEFTELLGPERVDMEGEPESFVRLKEGRSVLVLRHSAETNGCVFLEANGCSVHAQRPLACRTYPYDRPESGTGLGLVPGAMCPPETGILITLLRKPGDTHGEEFANAVRKRDEELKQHANFVARWNSHQRTRVRLGRTPHSEAVFLKELERDSGDAP